MPTPAVNREAKIPWNSNYWWTDDSNVGHCGEGSIPGAMLVSYMEKRPASVTHPVNQDGWRPPTPWYHSGATMTQAPSGFLAWPSSNSSCPGSKRIHYQTSVSSPPSTISLAGQGNLSNRALVKAINNLKSQDFNIGTFLGEARESINMIELSLASILGSVRKFKRTRPKDWAKVVKTQVGNLKKSDWKFIPESWLSVQYGWIPLMSDVSGACSALSSLADKTVPRVRVSGSARARWVEEIICGDNVLGGTGVVVSRAYESFVKFVLYYELADAQAALKSRLGLTNPLEIVWEVLPYSFVVDWFLPIGPYLGTLDAPNGWNFKSGTKSSLVKSEDKVSKRFRRNDWPILEYSSRPALYKLFDFNRTVLSTPPVPGLYVKSPISTKHVANLYALLAVTLGR